MTPKEYERARHILRYGDPETREKIKARVRTRARANPDLIRAGNKNYRTQHAVEIAAKQHARWVAIDPKLRILLTKEHHLWGRYRLSVEDFQELYRKQTGLCPICRQPLVVGIGVRGTHVDHDHVTGKIRGLLCFDCNRGLGIVERRDWLRAALWFLRQHEAEPV